MPSPHTPEPHLSGVLDVGDGQSLHWEWCGNAHGRPAVYLDGGPGSGIAPGSRRLLDLERFRVLLFDQRGCGRSRPSAGEPSTDLGVNTTQHLIADLERLRELHGIESWTLLGVSFGTTLGLAYSQTHPQRVDGLVLALVTTTSARGVKWITEDVGRVFPREWDRFAAAVPAELRSQRLVDAYATQLADPAWRLHQRWTTTTLRIVDDAGHGNGGLVRSVLDAQHEIADAYRH